MLYKSFTRYHNNYYLTSKHYTINTLEYKMKKLARITKMDCISPTTLHNAKISFSTCTMLKTHTMPPHFPYTTRTKIEAAMKLNNMLKMSVRS